MLHDSKVNTKTEGTPLSHSSHLGDACGHLSGPDVAMGLTEKLSSNPWAAGHHPQALADLGLGTYAIAGMFLCFLIVLIVLVDRN